MPRVGRSAGLRVRRASAKMFPLLMVDVCRNLPRSRRLLRPLQAGRLATARGGHQTSRERSHDISIGSRHWPCIANAGVNWCGGRNGCRAGAQLGPVGSCPSRLLLYRWHVHRGARQTDHASSDVCRGANPAAPAPPLSTLTDPWRRDDGDQLDGTPDGRPGWADFLSVGAIRSMWSTSRHEVDRPGNPASTASSSRLLPN